MRSGGELELAHKEGKKPLAQERFLPSRTGVTLLLATYVPTVRSTSGRRDRWTSEQENSTYAYC